MSDKEEETSEEKPFYVDRPKQGRAACKKCKDKCPAGELRIAKLQANPFGDGKMKSWHHVHCIFEQFLKQRRTTKRIESLDDVDGWQLLSAEDQDLLCKKIEDSEKTICNKFGLKWIPKGPPVVEKPASEVTNKDSKTVAKTSSSDATGKQDKNVLFKQFRRLVAGITNVTSYTDKTNLVRENFSKGDKIDINLWCKLLLPGVIKRIYNIKNKQLIKLYSKIFGTNQQSMLVHFQQGDIGETIVCFFEQSHILKPAKRSTLTLQEVDEFLEELSTMTKEEEQIAHFESITPKSTSGDLKIIIRLIMHDLRMGAGAKHILDGVHPDAYAAYQHSRNLDDVINRCCKKSKIQAAISLMTPVLPMLAEACKSIEQAMKKCPNGMYAEIKYDGERVQVHKQGMDFKYFSRSLKPVLPHKVAHFKEFIPKALPHARDLILDSEILVVDTITGKPLPFGTLGKHKKAELKNANVCLFIFDCIYYNGESLLNKPISYRKNILQDNMTEIPNRIMFSEMQTINKAEELASMIAKVLKLGLEGLVLKNVQSIYEPGKRHWLKVKKDYLSDGAMADTADLLVLGAWYGTGKKGGMMSIFLMGCYDPKSNKFRTVTKVHTGHDDKTLEELQTQLDMVKINAVVPDWLYCTKTMIPDFVARDPMKQPVWEITGSEFTQHQIHTADGISIRFPRVTRIRDDKSWEQATSLEELKQLYKASKENIDTSYLDRIVGSSSHKRTSNNEVETSSKKTDTSYHNLFTSETTNKRLSDEEEKASVKKMKIHNPLPDLFIGIKLFINCVNVDLAKLQRYFIAYGGTVLESSELRKATHVAHSTKCVKKQLVGCPKTVRHVTTEWIRDCLTNNSLQEYAPYAVILDVSL